MNVITFEGKVVIVTGASSGIGAACALLFSNYGAKLTLVGRDAGRLYTVASKCHQAKGLQPLIVQVDLTEKGACEKVVSSTVEQFGRLDVLVNSAGKLVLGSLFDSNIDAFDEMIDVNLRVPYKLTHQALPHLIKTKGNVVNITSNSNNKSRHGFLPLSVAKRGLNTFTKMAAFELAGEGVRVNSVNPGLTRTNILSNLALTDDEINSTYEGLKNDFHMKILEPEEVAKMVVFVASDMCPNINGADMSIDGGTAVI